MIISLITLYKDGVRRAYILLQKRIHFIYYIYIYLSLFKTRQDLNIFKFNPLLKPNESYKFNEELSAVYSSMRSGSPVRGPTTLEVSGDRRRGG